MPKYTMMLKTLQSIQIKNLFEGLKEILTDVDFEFDSKGLRILSVDVTRVLAIHMRLDAKQFEEYKCTKNLVLGVNLLRFHKILKNMDKSDILTIFYDEDQPNYLWIETENETHNKKTRCRLNLIEVGNEKIEIPDLTYPSIIILPAAEFHRICRNMNEWSDKIEIQSTDKQLILTSEGMGMYQKTVLGESDDGLAFEVNKKPDEITQGIYPLLYLVRFSKCAGLCDVIRLHLKNDMPLTILYDVVNLGQIKICLASIKNTKNKTSATS